MNQETNALINALAANHTTGLKVDVDKLPEDLRIYSVNQLIKDVQDHCGIDAAQDFAALVIHQKIPDGRKRKRKLFRYFRTRKDVISVKVTELLGKKRGNDAR